MVSFPPCKINLGLSILRKRSDGYHDIDTCFYPIPFTDILEVIPASSLEYSSSGSLIPGKDEDNLCVKAYHLLKKDRNIPPAKIHLHKIIPTGAGLGGGSSDAAHTLRLLNIVFELNLSQASLLGYASMLGSDCSFFIQDSPMIGSGRGEILQPGQVNLKGKYLVLLNPGLHISTSVAYAGVIPKIPMNPIRASLEKPIGDWKKFLCNDFELSVFEKFPVLPDMKNELYRLGADYASMSGSGSSLYGIFDNDPSIPGQSVIAPMVIWKGLL